MTRFYYFNNNNKGLWKTQRPTIKIKIMCYKNICETVQNEIKFTRKVNQMTTRERSQVKFKCQTSEFSEAIQIASHAVATKPQTPILSGIYMRAEEDGLVIMATDYEIGIVTKIAADVIETGEIVIEGHFLQETARKLPGEIMELDFAKNGNESKLAKISSNAYHVQLNVMNAEDFPKINQITGEGSFKLRDNILKRLIRRTSYACSTDDARPVFMGCLLELEGNTIRMVATNIHRLALAEDKLEGVNFEKKEQCIIPKRILEELLRDLTSEIPDDIEIGRTYSEICFSFGDTYITSRLIEGQFPEYRYAIPQEFATRVTIPVDEFKSAVDRISFVARSSDYNVISMNFSMGEVHLSSSNPEVGETSETMPVVIDGPDVEISFNVAYLIDVLKTLTSKEFYLSLNESLKPAAIREEGDGNFIYIATPVRTREFH